jgi:hypothetical protein
MTSSNRGTLIAVGFFLAAFLAFYIFVVRKPDTVPSATPTPQAGPLLRFSAANVDTIVIKVKGKAKTLSLKKTAAKWNFGLCAIDAADCPATEPADDGKVQQLAASLADLRPTTTVYGAPEGIAAYGLDQPSAEVSVTIVGGSKLTLLLGGRTPEQSGVYAKRLDADTIYALPATTVDAQLLPLIDSPPRPVPSPSPAAGPPASPSAAPGP